MLLLKTDIPQEQIEAEIRRIGTAGVQLTIKRFLLKQESRNKKEDLQSIFEQLKTKGFFRATKNKALQALKKLLKYSLTFPSKELMKNQKELSSGRVICH